MPSDPSPSPSAPAPGPIAPPDMVVAPVTATPAESVSPNRLTPEEQMALFEKELKENDWGHQPC
ncbi:MAG: hypothetical protein NTV51_16360 [Verrucomicrobia bacterium]|nr:hypothetical protein [Verrucomicrobiota bacterium]